MIGKIKEVENAQGLDPQEGRNDPAVPIIRLPGDSQTVDLRREANVEDAHVNVYGFDALQQVKAPPGACNDM